MSNAPRLRVLVVEDDPDTVEVLAMMFEWLGCDTRIASRGISAVELADVFSPELLFADIYLPDIDGYEVARRIRRRCRPFCVALTGIPQDHRTDVGAFFDQCYLKPIGLDAIRKVLGAVTRARKLLL
ncbi:MAG: response regulator [Deltaproteobacteria bacterium]|nr:response regulator [Deltaproteobacteria bacterium]